MIMMIEDCEDNDDHQSESILTQVAGRLMVFFFVETIDVGGTAGKVQISGQKVCGESFNCPQLGAKGKSSENEIYPNQVNTYLSM